MLTSQRPVTPIPGPVQLSDATRDSNTDATSRVVITCLGCMTRHVSCTCTYALTCTFAIFLPFLLPDFLSDVLCCDTMWRALRPTGSTSWGYSELYVWIALVDSCTLCPVKYRQLIFPASS